MGLANIAGPTQTVVLGALLIVGVLRPVIAARLVAPGLRLGGAGPASESEGNRSDERHGGTVPPDRAETQRRKP